MLNRSGKIVVSVTIENILQPDKKIRCDALVDTEASPMMLPSAWRERLGNLREVGQSEFETATQQKVTGVICGPVQIQIEGFRPVHSEVVFIDMDPTNGEYDPLLGYIILEQCPAAVDMLGHRLVPVTHLDLKRASVHRIRSVRAPRVTHLAGRIAGTQPRSFEIELIIEHMFRDPLDLNQHPSSAVSQ